MRDQATVLDHDHEMRRDRVAGIGRSVIFSIIVVLIINEPEILNRFFGTVYESPLLAWPWLFPIGTLCCFVAAFRGRSREA